MFCGIKNEPHTFTVKFPFLDVLTFQFLKVELKKQRWRDFLVQDNPVAAALLSKMGYNKDEKVAVKKEFLRMLVRLELDPARMQIISGFFDTYLKLSDKEDHKLEAEIRNLNPEEEAKIMQLTTSWHQKGREQGREEGNREARQEIAKKM
jgi:flagellar biosynthesis/type III secretory pathway protein FliH